MTTATLELSLPVALSMFSDLVGKKVSGTESEPAALDRADATLRGVFVADNTAPGALYLLDLELAASLGAALVMMPAGLVREGVGDRALVGALEAIRWIALFRLALPEVILRYAGGREVTLGDLQQLGMEAGINALIVGNYLTTLGRGPDEDLVMLQQLRMPIGTLSKVI